MIQVDPNVSQDGGRFEARYDLGLSPVLLVQFSPVLFASFDALDSETNTARTEAVHHRYRTDLKGDVRQFQ